MNVLYFVGAENYDGEKHDIEIHAVMLLKPAILPPKNVFLEG